MRYPYVELYQELSKSSKELVPSSTTTVVSENSGSTTPLPTLSFGGLLNFCCSRAYGMVTHCGLICGKKGEFVIRLSYFHLGYSVEKVTSTIDGLYEMQ